MGITSIEWADKVWNPVTGCTKVSQGCKHCYAETVAERFFARQYPPVYIGPGADEPADEFRARRFTDVQTHADRLDAPLQWRKPARVFVNSMSDLFHEDVPDQFITDVFGIMALAHWHTFLVLTKRPERMRAYLAAGDHGIVAQFEAVQQRGGIGPRAMFAALDVKRRDGVGWAWPLPNVHLGVSVEDQATADLRIPILLQTPAAVRWVSAEPLLSSINFGAYMYESILPRPPIDWIVVGGESGPKARPCDVAWIRSVVAQCKAAGVPAFVKQLGALPVQQCGQCGRTIGRVLGGWVDACGPTHALLIAESLCVGDRKGASPSQWPKDLHVQQFPEARP